MKQNVRTSNEFLHTLLMKVMCGMVMLLSAVSCTDETESMGQSSPLTMNITVNDGASRAVIESGALPDGSLVGVTVVDASGTTYNGNNYSNIKGTTSGTSLSLAGEVLITDTDATIYGYYPWASGVSETAVPLTAGSTDYLYAAPITGINNGNAFATLSMSHALTCLRLKINRGYYSGTGALTTLTVESASLSTAGTLNARTGTVTATGPNVYETNISQTIGDATLTQDIMVIPTGTAGDITFTLLVDGNQYYVTTENVTLTKGGMYEYTINIEPLTWDNAPNGVYAVKKEGNTLVPVTYADADESCIAVALIVNDAPTPQRLMIEKYEEAQTVARKAAYDEFGATNTAYKYLYCGGYGTDQTGIPTYSAASSISTYGYIPLIDGTYYSTSTTQLGVYTTWSGSYALNDWNGVDNSEVIKTVLTNGTSSSNTYAPMGIYLNKFNATPSENQGFSDWYIPSCAQLALIHTYTGRNSSYGGDVTEGINAMLTKIGGTKIDTSDYYWSSSEYSSYLGWGVNFNNGYVGYNSKSSYVRVRVVRDF